MMAMANNRTASKTARQKLRNYTRYLDSTLEAYRGAQAFINRVAYEHRDEILAIEWSGDRVMHLEHLIHSTSRSKAAYPGFDTQYYKFPSYLRRYAILQAIGHVSSHVTRTATWEAKPKGKRPAFNPECKSFPVFYKDNMAEWVSRSKVRLKLYTGKDWIWFTLPFEPVREERFDGYERDNPMLVKTGKRWRLHIPYEKKITWDKATKKQPVLSVDLGLNHTATWSVVRADGTVTARGFITRAGEKDRLDTQFGRIAMKYRQTFIVPENQRFCARDWDRVNALSDEIAHQTSHELVEVARAHDCHTIVFEHLGKLRVPKGFYGARRMRKKLHYWMQGRIQRYTRYKAKAYGIRFSRVLARGTSLNAFDGSGEVVRNGNCAVATFPSGKKYSADLSAAYNIGARYWIRYLSTHEESRSGNGKVAGRDISSAPVDRHRQTLASLISLAGRPRSLGAPARPVPYSGQCFSPHGETATMPQA